MLGIENEIYGVNIKYFNDIDTALVEFSDNTVQGTHEISENIYIDIDANGNLVSMTIEHAGKTAHLPVFPINRSVMPLPHESWMI